MWILDLWYRPILKPDFIDTFENEGEVLRSSRTFTSVSLDILLVRIGVGRQGDGVRYRFNLCCLGSGIHFWKFDKQKIDETNQSVLASVIICM